MLSKKTALQKIFFVIIACLASHNASAQNYCIPDRFDSKDYFRDNQVEKLENIQYGQAVDWTGVMLPQKFNISYPKFTDDSLKHRPFILLVHGGGFNTETANSSKSQMQALCNFFARKGYVAATIDYRVGWLWNRADSNSKEKIKTSIVLAEYRAYQDTRAALRYFVKNADIYGIDTSAIFLGGRSSGGNISLVTAFFSQNDIDKMLSKKSVEKCRSTLGSIDSSTNTVTADFKIRGIIDMWGAIFDTTYIDRGEALTTPIIMFHGTEDRIVVYGSSSSAEYPYSQFGSYCVGQRYKHLGGCYTLHSKIGGAHAEDFSDEFLAEKSASFLKSILCNNCQSKEYSTKLSTRISKKLLALIFAVVAMIVGITHYVSKRRQAKA